MRKIAAVIWILLTILPIVYISYLISYLISYSSMPFANMTFEEAKTQFDTVYRLQLMTFILIVSMVISYRIYLSKTSYVPQDKKAIWASLLLLGSIISMPAFWYLYVWRPLNSVNKDSGMYQYRSKSNSS